VPSPRGPTHAHQRPPCRGGRPGRGGQVLENRETDVELANRPEEPTHALEIVDQGPRASTGNGRKPLAIPPNQDPRPVHGHRGAHGGAPQRTPHGSTGMPVQPVTHI
jgi:hypothetical protein